MFNSARIKLTIWYSFILLLISGTLSVLVYLRISSTLDEEFREIERRLQLEREKFYPRPVILPGPFRILPEDIARAKQRVAWQLIFVNGTIVAIFAAAGYFLSTRTLRPIQKALDEQKRFIGDAAHELKTPITALKTSLEVNLMNENLPKNTRQILKENLQDLNSLNTLVENLLDLAKNDQLVSNFERVALADIINLAVKRIQALAKKKQVMIEASELSKPITLEGNPLALERLWVIFLDNAIKFSPKKSKVTISADQKSGWAFVKIQDQGAGIAPEHLPHIFERFYRVDQARVTGGGYGLGLALAKKIVEQHHGSISVESEVGKGTTFIVKLPLKQPKDFFGS